MIDTPPRRAFKRVRKATERGIDQVLPLYSQFIKTSVWASYLILDPIYARECLVSALNDCFYLYYVEDQVVGFIWGKAINLPFSREKVATELAWWVEPEFRGQGIGRELFEWYNDWAFEEDCKCITLGGLKDNTTRFELVAKMYVSEV